MDLTTGGEGVVGIDKMRKSGPPITSPGARTESEMTKARPNPGEVLVSGRMEKMNEVEKDGMAVPLFEAIGEG